MQPLQGCENAMTDSGAVAAEGSGVVKRSVTEPSGVQIPPRPPSLAPTVGTRGWGVCVVFYSQLVSTIFGLKVERFHCRLPGSSRPLHLIAAAVELGCRDRVCDDKQAWFYVSVRMSWRNWIR